MFLSLFNSFASTKFPHDIVCLQDPRFWHASLSSFQNFTSFAPLASSGRKPKVAFYVSSYLLAQATILPSFFDRLDGAALDVLGVNLFRKSFYFFRILNLYNLWTKRTSQMTVSPFFAFRDSPSPTLLVGDFNIHHPFSDPLRSHSAEELATSFPYFSRMSELGYDLLNQPGVFTYFPLGSCSHPSVLDPFFASAPLLLFCQA